MQWRGQLDTDASESLARQAASTFFFSTLNATAMASWPPLLADIAVGGEGDGGGGGGGDEDGDDGAEEGDVTP